MAETMAGAGSRIPNDVDVVGTGVFRLRTLMVNVYLVAVSGSADWVLIDAGIRGYARTIERAARTLFGSRPPLGILLTHAHFDHVGSLRALLRRWDVPVHAHMLEFPYLTGRLSYPPPDPTVGGGAMARLSFLYPRGPIDISAHLLALPENGNVPHLANWRWWRTHGHSPGHVSFFRLDDHVLVAGDAVVTTRQESLARVALQRPEVRPPPAYFTLDWEAAVESVRAMAALNPEVLATGHGPVMRGAPMRDALHRLAARRDAIVPTHGRYVEPLGEAARTAGASQSSAGRTRRWGLAAGATVAALLAWRRARMRHGHGRTL